MFFSLHRLQPMFSPEKKGRVLRLEELEARRLLSADTPLITAMDAAHDGAACETAEIANGADTESALVSNSAISNALTLYATNAYDQSAMAYTLSLTGSFNTTTLVTDVLYLNIFFSSVGLNKVSQAELKAQNSSCNLLINGSVSENLMVPSFKIANLNRFLATNYSVVFGKDTGTNTGSGGLSTTDNTDSTDWYLQFTWNNANGLWNKLSDPFTLVDLILPISEDAVRYVGTLDFNFALRDYDGLWNVCYQNSETLLADALKPHLQILLPGKESLATPNKPTVDSTSVTWNGFDITWNSVPEASGYVVGWKKSDSMDSYTESEILTEKTFSLTKLSGGTQYQVAVRAITESGAGNSAWSKSVLQTTVQDTPYDIIPQAVSISENTKADTLVTQLSAKDLNPAHINTLTFTLSAEQQYLNNLNYFEIRGTDKNSIYLKQAVSAGTYELWVTAKDAVGFESEPTKLVITVVKAPKAVVNSSSLSVLCGCNFFLSGSESTAFDNRTIDGYFWDLNGDNRVDRSENEFYASISELGTLNSDGTRTVQFWVTDSEGWTSAKTQIKVTVVDRAESIYYSSAALSCGMILKLSIERFELGGKATASWKILWDAGSNPSDADWENAESFDTTANTLRAVHYYAPKADDTVYSVRLRLVTADKTTEFSLANHSVAGTSLNESFAETPTPVESVPSETIRRTTDVFALAAPINQFAMPSRLESTFELTAETTNRPSDSDALLKETSALETRAAELLADPFAAVLWENRVYALSPHDLALNAETDSAIDTELNETLETVFLARQPSLPDD